MRIRIFDDADRLAEAAAQEIESWVRLKAPGVPIGFAGGSTPKGTYLRLRKSGIPWGEVSGWITDERFVPPDDPASNSGMLARTLFDHVPATLYPVPWIEDPMAAADAYEKELAGLLDPSLGGIKPGLILLGVGEDGHTASLFPDSDALDVVDRDYVAHWVPQLESWRLTATLPLLTRARRTMFLVSGSHKAQIVAEVLEGDANYPAAIVSRESRDAVWLLDRDAASLLSSS